jgi:hypothetical protein
MAATTSKFRSAFSRLNSKARGGYRYEVDWPGENRVMTVWGFDGVQALLHALQIIGAEIYSSNYHKAGQLFFGKPGSGYGFPVMSNIRDLLQGNDKKYL